MLIPRKEHGFKDSELCNGSTIANIVGVSPAAITKKTKNGTMDTYENSKGRACYHRELSVQQFLTKKDRSKVTTATRGQRAAGMSNSQAQSVSRVVGAENPNGGLMQRMSSRVAENVQQISDWKAMFNDLEFDLETSRAVKETQMARLAALKADEKDGLLVDKHLVFQKNYQATNELQEKLTSLYAKIAPVIVGDIIDQCVNAGVNADVLGDIKSQLEHSCGERIRISIVETLRELTDKMMSEEKFYG